MSVLYAILAVAALFGIGYVIDKAKGAVVNPVSRAVNQKLLYRSEHREGHQIVSAPLTVEVPASVPDVMRALTAHVAVADTIPIGFKAVVYESSRSADHITYALGNKVVPKTFEVAVSLKSRGATTEAIFKVLTWTEREGLIVAQDVLMTLRGQVEAAFATLGASTQAVEDPTRTVNPAPRSSSSQLRQWKRALEIVGIILALIAIIKISIIGFYPREAPLYFGLLLAGGICVYISTKIKVGEEDVHPAGERTARGSTTLPNARRAQVQAQASIPVTPTPRVPAGDSPVASSTSAEVARDVGGALCSSCAASLRPGAAFCSDCGAAVGAGRPPGGAVTESGVAAAARTSLAASRSGDRHGKRTVVVAALALAVVVVAVIAVGLAGSHSESPVTGNAASNDVAAASAPALDESLEADNVADPELVAGLWIAQPSGTKANLIHLAFVDSENAWAVGDQGAIVASSDGGWTWAQQSSGTGATLFGVAFADASRGWAVGEHGTILATDDGGASWANRDARTSQSLYDVALLDAALVCAVGRGGIIVSSGDSGETWQQDSSGTGAWLSGVAFFDSGQALVVGEHGTILRSSEDSETWTSCDSGTSAWLCGVCAPDSVHAWAVGSEGVIVATEDGGDTWTQQHSGTSNNLYGVAFADAVHGWAVGEKGTLLTTGDGGASWSAYDGLTDQNLWGVGFTSASKGCAVGDRGTILTASVGE